MYVYLHGIPTCLAFQITSNFLVGGYMRSDNLQLPHKTSNFLMIAMVIMVATVMVVMVVVDRTGRETRRLGDSEIQIRNCNKSFFLQRVDGQVGLG